MSKWKLDIDQINVLQDEYLVSTLALHASNGMVIITLMRKGKRDKTFQDLAKNALVLNDYISLPKDLYNFLKRVSDGENVDPNTIEQRWANVVLYKVCMALFSRLILINLEKEFCDHTSYSI